MARTVKIGRVKGSMWYTDLTNVTPLDGDMWFDKSTSSVYQYKNNKWEKIDKLPTKVSELINDADYVNLETLNDAIDGVEDKIPYGDRTYVYVNGLTSSNTIQDLIDYLTDFNLFDETKKYKYYLKFSDDTILENIQIKYSAVTKPTRKTVYNITSIIRGNQNILIYIGSILSENLSTITIKQLKQQHNQIATMQDIADLVNSAPETLDTLGELAQAFSENKEVVEALNEAITNKADKTYVDEKDQQLFASIVNLVQQLETNKANKTDVYTKVEVDEKIANIDVSGGVSEEEVLNIIEENSVETDSMSIGVSTNYNTSSDTQIPTTKAVYQMIEKAINSVLEAEY